MKILIVTHCFPPHIGGLEEVAFQQARELAKRGHQVEVVTSDIGNTNEKLKDGIIEGIKVYRVSATDFLYDKFEIPQPIFNIFELNKKLKELIKKVDIVHIHERFFMSSFFAARIAKKYKKPICLTLHADVSSFYKNYFLKFLFLINTLISKPVVKSANKIIILSKELKKRHDIINKNFIIMHNFVDTKKFFPINNSENKNKLKIKRNIPSNKFVILYVGRLVYKKGPDIILNVAKKLKDYDDLLFLLVGGGPMEKEIESYIKKNNLKNIIKTGRVPSSLLSEYYRLADIFIFPSRGGESSTPLVMLEALSSGLPVIVINTGDHAKVIENNKTGFIVGLDINEIAEKIIYLYKNQNLLMRMSKQCRLFIENEFTLEKNIYELEKIYNSILKKE